MLRDSCAGLNKASFSKRLSTSIINLLFYIFIGIFFQFTVMENTYLSWTGYNALKIEFTSLNEEYEAKQDYYHIYIYEDETRIYNENVTQSDSDSFFADERVIEIREITPEIEKKLNFLNFTSYAITFTITPLISSIIFSFLFRKGRNLGCLVNNLKYAQNDGKPLQTKAIFKYVLLNWFFLYFCGLLTLGIYPAIELGHVYYSENHLTRLEEKLNIQYYDKA